jgi:hypothetical protein
MYMAIQQSKINRATFLLYYLIRLIFTVVTKYMMMSDVSKLVCFHVNTMFGSLSYTYKGAMHGSGYADQHEAL